MEYSQQSQPSIYSEKFDTTNELRVLGLVIGSIAVLVLGYLWQTSKMDIINSIFVLSFAAIFFFTYFFQRTILVEYTADAIIIRRGKHQTRIGYSEIESAWLSPYHAHKGRVTTENRLDTNAAAWPFNSKMHRAELLVWNFNTATLGASWAKKEIILKVSNKDALRILHAQNQEYVLSLLKKQAPNIRFLD